MISDARISGVGTRHEGVPIRVHVLQVRGIRFPSTLRLRVQDLHEGLPVLFARALHNVPALDWLTGEWAAGVCPQLLSIEQ